MSPSRVLQHIGFPIFSNSKPLQHLSFKNKYCELKPDDRLEYQIYLGSFSEAAEVSSSGSADPKRNLFELGAIQLLCVYNTYVAWLVP